MSALFTYTDIPLLDRRSKVVPTVPTVPPSQHDNSLLHIERQTRHLQRNLQCLLDAQGEGLLAGLAGPNNDDTCSNGSPTPTPSAVSSPRGAPTIPVRQPLKKRVSLRAARKGIFRSMHELLRLKEEERRIIAGELEERRDVLMEVDGFASKEQGLKEVISEIQNSRDGRKSGELKEEARNLEKEIHELEIKLSEMKSRYRHVVNEISHIENSFEAKLSSYQASLSLLESEIRKYLQNPPLKQWPFASTDTTFYSLNPKRRTLDMARQHWGTEQAELMKRLRGIDREIGALEEGGSVWLRIIDEVSSFEKRLKEEMDRSLQTQPHDPNLLNLPMALQNKSDEDQAELIIQDMDETIRRIEDKLSIAEEKDWKLLICCIGAELEAFKEGKAILLETLRIPEKPTLLPERLDSGDLKSGKEQSNSPGEPINLDDEASADLLRDAASSPQDGVVRSEDEDDEPDPSWLLSDN
ncbi:hypothetical protein Egran_02468 [Elaphomyces granulatus]|uniref:Atg28p n=1 Tax=Elaphomyces granulatus TaxID=519963 RepID=A0A232M037_9EURO|nr:hypothetical protein Egran_02468 [Elaphomyces granulatus]